MKPIVFALFRESYSKTKVSLPLWWTKLNNQTRKNFRMVFAGQDAWRKHPLIYGCYKKPFPGLGVAVGIFGIYLAMDTAFKMTSGKNNH